jgi:uncharacterized protein YuzE
MTIRVGEHEFDDVVFDADADVLYMHKGKPVPAQTTIAAAEGHAVMLDHTGEIIGITIINARWLAVRDGRITVTIPEIAPQPGRLETSAEDLAAALAA